ncbi:MAG TPA: hypothetical protein VHY58_18850 [Streptosporangiaceae bacterium]|jgi:hypothetical protein|nr:hypothetical protein [Streptosporangiaceae bacterium]
MYPHLTDQLVSQHQTDVRTDARHTHRFVRSPRNHRNPVRRRAGYALVSLGLRLAYAAGED